MSRHLLATLCALSLAAVLPSAALADHHHGARDRNHDGLPDRWERAHHLSLRFDQARRDQDHDGLDNRQELHRGTDPRRADTDRDGIGDGREARLGTNPRRHDRTRDVGSDEANAGTVRSFTADSGSPSTGTLVIALADGSTMTGRVTSGTELRCDGSTAGAADSKHGSDDGPGDDRGGENEPGDDRGDDGAAMCSTADLTPGATVHEAKLVATGSGPAFEEVELAR